MTDIDLTPHKRIRIAVSGDVALNRLECRVIDTRDFQRLRGIRQLGTACMVYPTALHTRFDHSLGVLAMTDRMLRAIRDNADGPTDGPHVSGEQEQLARLYALLHDIMHVPFGHTIEDECSILVRHDMSAGRVDRFVGEGSTVGAILLEELGRGLYDRLLALLHSGTRGDEDIEDDYFILDLVTGTVCADLLDYLQRDAHFCNISLDADYRFLRHLSLSRQGRRTRMVVRLWKEGKATPRRDVLNELIRLLDNRYLMGERVYFHPAKLITGAMLAGAVARATGEGELRGDLLHEMGDDVLMDRLTRSGRPAVARLAGAHARRRLWKPVYERTRGLVRAEQQAMRAVDVFQDLMERYYGDPVSRVAEERRLAELVGLEDGDLLIYCPHERMSMKLAEVAVFWNGTVRSLKDCSDDELVGAKLQSILDSHQNLWSIRVFLNPERLGRRDTVADACDALFTYDPSRRRRAAAQFYRPILERRARELGGEDPEGRAGRALEALLEQEEGRRTLAAIDAALEASEPHAS